MKILKKRWQKALIVALTLLLLMGAAFFIYTLDYYKADEVAVQALVEYDDMSVQIQALEDMILFKPRGEEATTGFIFYPGGKVEYTAYVSLMKKIAEEGYACVLLNMPFNLAVFDINGAERGMEALPQVRSWYIGGHSLGGAMASSFAEKNSNKLTGIIFLGAYPSADLSMTELKMLSIYGTEDLVLNRDSFDKNKDNAPAYVEYYEIEGGNHAYFGNYGEQKGDGKASITVEAQQKETVDTIVKFIETK